MAKHKQWIVAATLAALAAAVQAAPGDLDTTFSGDGIVTTAVSTNSETINAALVQPDGKLVVVGTPDNTKFMVIRYNVNGTLDTGFDADGIALIDVDPASTTEVAKDIALQADGKMVLVGTVSNSTFIVLRLNANGSLDTTFAGDGIFDLANAGTARAVAALPNGKIIAGGDQNFIRLTPSGELDNSFDGDGILPTTDLARSLGTCCGGVYRLAVLPNGKILAVPEIRDLISLNSDGSLDKTYGNNGVVESSLSWSPPYQIVVQPDGKTVFAGSKSETISGVSVTRLAVQRVNADGSLDGTFGLGGIALGPIPPSGGSGDAGQAVAVQADGKVIAVGNRSVSPVPPKTEGTDLIITRFLPNGSLDTSFAATGTRVIDVSSSGNLTAAAVDGNGKIYAAGDLRSPTTGLVDIYIARIEGDPVDTAPDTFTLVDATDVEPGEYVSSNTVNVAGLSTEAQVPVTVTNGELSINGSAFKNQTGFVRNGDSIVVRHLASNDLSTAVNSTLTFGGMTYQNSPANIYGTKVSDTFTSTTAAADTTPRAFAFSAHNNAATGSVRTSNTLTISGINTTTPIAVTGGAYSIGCNGSFTTADGTITKNQTVCVRHTASDQFSTAVNTVLTIGGVSAAFTSTTEPQDAVPDDFKFPSVNNAAISTVQTSAAVTIAGINMPVTVSITGGEYSIGCGATFISTESTLTSGQTVCVRHTSASAVGSAVTTTLKVGGTQGTFTSTTFSQDAAPAKFAFEPQVNVARTTTVTSNAVTVTGINAATPISVTDGEYSIGCSDPFVAITGTINNGQKVCVRHVSASGFSSPMVTVLDIGGTQAAFTSTTMPPDISPNLFSFKTKSGVEPGAPVISDVITVLGIDVPAAVIVTNGEYSIGCNGTFTSANGNVDNGQTICVRHTAATNLETTMTTSLSVGTETATFSSDTRPQQSNVVVLSNNTNQNKPNLGAIDAWWLAMLFAPLVVICAKRQNKIMASEL